MEEYEGEGDSLSVLRCPLAVHGRRSMDGFAFITTHAFFTRRWQTSFN